MQCKICDCTISGYLSVSYVYRYGDARDRDPPSTLRVNVCAGCSIKVLNPIVVYDESVIQTSSNVEGRQWPEAKEE